MFEDEDLEEMEMPTPCMRCGTVFDLTDGVSFCQTVYCESCGTRKRKIRDLEWEEDDEKKPN